MSKHTKAGRRAAFRRHCNAVADRQARAMREEVRRRYGVGQYVVRRVFTTMPGWHFTVSPYTSQRNVTGGWR